MCPACIGSKRWLTDGLDKLRAAKIRGCSSSAGTPVRVLKAGLWCGAAPSKINQTRNKIRASRCLTRSGRPQPPGNRAMLDARLKFSVGLETAPERSVPAPRARPFGAARGLADTRGRPAPRRPCTLRQTRRSAERSQRHTSDTSEDLAQVFRVHGGFRIMRKPSGREYSRTSDQSSAGIL